MAGSWLSQRGVRRAATTGLAVGLAALAVLTVAAAVSVGRAIEQVRASNRITSTWEQVFVGISDEDEALQKFLLTRTYLDRVRLENTIGSAEDELTWLASADHADQEFAVTQFRLHYTRYQNSLRAVASAASRNLTPLVEANVQPAVLGFATLRRIAVANVERERAELASYLDGVQGRNQTLLSTAVVVFAADVVTFVLCTAILIGYQRRVEQQAQASRHQALHDALTGLANRVLFRDRAEQTLQLARRSNRPFALIAMDLNGFKQVNDNLGHHSGDVLLQQVAARLTGCVRDADTVARLGGDEFTILLPDVTSVEDATEVAYRVVDAIGQPVDLEGVTAEVGVSIGVTVFPDHGEDIESLMHCADQAMYSAKRGRLGVCVAGAPQQEPYIDIGDVTASA